MAVTPLPLCPWVEQRFGLVSVSGYLPNALGLVHTFSQGTASDKDTYTGHSTADPVHTNPIELDADGRPPSPIYLHGAYTFEVCDENDDPLYSVDYVADVGALYAQSYGAGQAVGSSGITTSPYVVLATDRTITIDSTTNPFIVTLPDVTTWQFPLFVMNQSDSVTGGTVRLTPQAGQTINFGIQGTAYFALPTATTVIRGWALCYPDAAESNWNVFSNAV